MADPYAPPTQPGEPEADFIRRLSRYLTLEDIVRRVPADRPQPDQPKESRQ